MNERPESEAVREKPLSCPADPNPHFLADCFEAAHAAMLGRNATRAMPPKDRRPQLGTRTE